jgi:hypothetical protein
MNYFIHQGNQAHTYLALNVIQEFGMDGLFEVWAGSTIKDQFSIVFSGGGGPPSVLFNKKEDGNRNPHFYPELNNVKLYTWSDSVIGLKAGARSADLALKRADGVSDPTLSEVTEFQNHINDGLITHLLIQAGHPSEPQSQNKESYRLKDKRQLVTLTKEALALSDPATGKNILRVWWKENLHFNICTNIDLFHGNILSMYHGEIISTTFMEEPTNAELIDNK